MAEAIKLYVCTVHLRTILPHLVVSERINKKHDSCRSKMLLFSLQRHKKGTFSITASVWGGGGGGAIWLSQ